MALAQGVQEAVSGLERRVATTLLGKGFAGPLQEVGQKPGQSLVAALIAQIDAGKMAPGNGLKRL